MIYCYDAAIVDDLIHSFNPDHVDEPVVKVIAPDGMLGLAAQIQNDEIKFPIVALTRVADSVDSNRMNFTRAHKGTFSVIDPSTNELYYEKSIPIDLQYNLTVLTTNTADMDEIVRELIFKYISMYFLTITLPYECSRKVRFGVIVDSSKTIDKSSGSFEYLENGQLYQTIIPLKCEGCVMVTYTPVKLKRSEAEISVSGPK